MVNLLIYALSVFLVGSVLVFLKAVTIDRRTKQWAGFLMALLALPLFLFYYNDQVPFQAYRLRWLVDPVTKLTGGVSSFTSSLTSAYIIGGLYLVRVVVFLRMIVKSRRDPQKVNEDMRRVNDKVGNFFAYTTIAILLGAIIVSAFSLGWIGSVIVALVFVMLYLGVIGIFADTLELTAATSVFGGVWLRRKLLWLTTSITRPFVWIAALYRAIKPSLRDAITRIRQATKVERDAFDRDAETGNRKIIKAGLKEEEQSKDD